MSQAERQQGLGIVLIGAVIFDIAADNRAKNAASCATMRPPNL